MFIRGRRPVIASLPKVQAEVALDRICFRLKNLDRAKPFVIFQSPTDMPTACPLIDKCEGQDGYDVDYILHI